MCVGCSVLGACFDQCKSGIRCGRFEPLMRISVVIGRCEIVPFKLHEIRSSEEIFRPGFRLIPSLNLFLSLDCSILIGLISLSNQSSQPRYLQLCLVSPRIYWGISPLSLSLLNLYNPSRLSLGRLHHHGLPKIVRWLASLPG